MITPPGSWACLDTLGKHSREMTLIRKARIQRDGAQRFVSVEDEFLGPLDALVQQPLMRRASHGLLESPAELARRQTASACQLQQAEIAREIGAQHFLGAPLLPRRQAAADVFRPELTRKDHAHILITPEWVSAARGADRPGSAVGDACFNETHG